MRNNDSLIFDIVLNNDLELLKKLVPYGVNFNIKNNKSLTPLLYSIEHDMTEMTKFLIDNNADIDLSDNQNNTALHYAAYYGNFEIVNLLIEKGANIDAVNTDNSTPLYFATSANKINIAKLLVEKGAKLIPAGKYHYTPLHLALANKNSKIAEILIKNTNDIESLERGDKYNYTPLHMAVINGNADIIELLLNKGITIDEESKYDDQFILEQLGYFINFHEQKKLCKKTPLHYAIEKNDINICKLLIDKMKYFNAKEAKNGFTPLLCAIDNERTEIVKLLLDKVGDRGEVINALDKEGYSPLHLAIGYGYNEIAKMLIEKNADIRTVNNEGVNIFNTAAQCNNIPMVEFLLEKKFFDVNMQDKNGNTPLHYTVHEDNIECTKILLEKGADINIQDVDGYSALFRAVETKDIKIVKLLLENGANIKLKDNEDHTPLYWAVYFNDFDIAQLLVNEALEKNIDIDYLFNKDSSIKNTDIRIIELIDKAIESQQNNQEEFTEPTSLTSKRSTLKEYADREFIEQDKKDKILEEKSKKEQSTYFQDMVNSQNSKDKEIQNNYIN